MLPKPKTVVGDRRNIRGHRSLLNMDDKLTNLLLTLGAVLVSLAMLVH
jgi:hypothetical protein